MKVALVLLAAGRAAAQVLASRKAACEAVRLFVNEGGIDHEAGIALILGQWAEHTIPDAAGGPTREALVNPFVLAVALRPSRSRGRRNAAPTTRH